MNDLEMKNILRGGLLCLQSSSLTCFSKKNSYYLEEWEAQVDHCWESFLFCLHESN